MWPRGAKMRAFNDFKESLLQNAQTIQGLSGFRIQQLPESKVEGIRADLWKLIKGDTGIKVSVRTRASNNVLIEARWLY